VWEWRRYPIQYNQMISGILWSINHIITVINICVVLDFCANQRTKMCLRSPFFQSLRNTAVKNEHHEAKKQPVKQIKTIDVLEVCKISKRFFLHVVTHMGFSGKCQHRNRKTFNSKYNVRSGKVREDLNDGPPILRIERPQLRWIDKLTRIFQETLAWQALVATSTGERLRGWSRNRWREYISDLACSHLDVV